MLARLVHVIELFGEHSAIVVHIEPDPFGTRRRTLKRGEGVLALVEARMNPRQETGEQKIVEVVHALDIEILDRAVVFARAQGIDNEGEQDDVLRIGGHVAAVLQHLRGFDRLIERAAQKLRAKERLFEVQIALVVGITDRLAQEANRDVVVRVALGGACGEDRPRKGAGRANGLASVGVVLGERAAREGGRQGEGQRERNEATNGGVRRVAHGGVPRASGSKRSNKGVLSQGRAAPASWVTIVAEVDRTPQREHTPRLRQHPSRSVHEANSHG